MADRLDELLDRQEAYVQMLDVFASPGWTHVAADLISEKEIELADLLDGSAVYDDLLRARANVNSINHILELPARTAERLKRVQKELEALEGEITNA